MLTSKHGSQSPSRASKLSACKHRYGKLIEMIEKTGKKSSLLEKAELQLASVREMKLKEKQEKLEKQNNQNDPSKQMLGKMFKEFF